MGLLLHRQCKAGNERTDSKRPPLLATRSTAQHPPELGDGARVHAAPQDGIQARSKGDDWPGSLLPLPQLLGAQRLRRPAAARAAAVGSLRGRQLERQQGLLVREVSFCSRSGMERQAG